MEARPEQQVQARARVAPERRGEVGGAHDTRPCSSGSAGGNHAVAAGAPGRKVSWRVCRKRGMVPATAASARAAQAVRAFHVRGKPVQQLFKALCPPAGVQTPRGAWRVTQQTARLQRRVCSVCAEGRGVPDACCLRGRRRTGNTRGVE